MKIWAEYIWYGGKDPDPEKQVKTLRSKGRTIEVSDPFITLEDIPDWAFDGSSTYQAEGARSDVRLKPVAFIPDPLRKISENGNILVSEHGNILVLCETYNIDGTPHPTNTRRRLMEAVKKYKDHEALFGFEQEYTLYDRDGLRPLRWPRGGGYPAPQGRYYCGVGIDEEYGYKIKEEHTRLCLKAGLKFFGTNAEVMPGQAEFQIGPLPAPDIADQLLLARWLLFRVAADYEVTVKLSPKPVLGDWNGAGCHVNFSTKAMRRKGKKAIDKACSQLGKFHKEHIAVYGPFNHERLTGKHETAPITQFRVAPYDRGASVRIPISTMDKKWHGYIEDRRPAANIDPYEVCLAMLETVCGEGFKPYREPDVELADLNGETVVVFRPAKI